MNRPDVPWIFNRLFGYLTGRFANRHYVDNLVDVVGHDNEFIGADVPVIP